MSVFLSLSIIRWLIIEAIWHKNVNTNMIVWMKPPYNMKLNKNNIMVNMNTSMIV